MKKILVLFLFVIFLCPQNVFAKKKEAADTPKNNGYVGTLPDLNNGSQSSLEEDVQPSFEYQDGFNDPNAIKPIPRNNPAFINIIMKQDKSSQYINDLNEIIGIIENLQTVVEQDGNVQVFNAKASFLKENVEYFRDKYQNKSEESYVSFKKLMQLNTHTQAVAQLRSTSEAYSPYVTAEGSGNTFSQNNINLQLDYLLDDIKKTLVVLKETR